MDAPHILDAMRKLLIGGIPYGQFITHMKQAPLIQLSAQSGTLQRRQNIGRLSALSVIFYLIAGLRLF